MTERAQEVQGERERWSKGWGVEVSSHSQGRPFFKSVGYNRRQNHRCSAPSVLGEGQLESGYSQGPVGVASSPWRWAFPCQTWWARWSSLYPAGHLVHQSRCSTESMEQDDNMISGAMFVSYTKQDTNIQERMNMNMPSKYKRQQTSTEF